MNAVSHTMQAQDLVHCVYGSYTTVHYFTSFYPSCPLYYMPAYQITSIRAPFGVLTERYRSDCSNGCLSQNRYSAQSCYTCSDRSMLYAMCVDGSWVARYSVHNRNFERCISLAPSIKIREKEGLPSDSE